MRLFTRVVAAALVVVAAVGAPTAQAVQAPKTLAASRPVTDAPVVPGFAIDFLGVLWEGPGGSASARVRHDGHWGAWQTLGADGAESAGENASALLAGEGADAYQVRIPAGGRDGRAVAINATDGPMIEIGRQHADAANAAPAVVSRAGWGADESLRFDATGKEVWPATYFPVQKLTVHHTATANGSPDPAAAIRAIYRYHAVDRGYGDIGYQYLIDESGRVYEGRWSGDDGDPAHDAAGRGVVGAHVGGYNSGNLGIALLGTLTEQAPTAAARDALEGQLADLSLRHGVDPTATSMYTNPVNGATWTGPSIAGHRDWEATECPGGSLYALLPSIRTAVKARMTSGTTSTTSTSTTSTTTAPTTTSTTTVTATVHIGALSGSSTAVNQKSWRATIAATVHDRDEVPVSGARVTLAWNGGSAACTTNTDGRCSVTTPNLNKRWSALEIWVTDIAATGRSYSSADDHDPAPTGRVTISRP